jgi:tetraacyldisaccharide 4'-kinase
VFAVAGIARPERFFDDLAKAGWRLGGTMAFRDHHRFTPADVTRIAHAARDAQTHVVVTTAKDAVRFESIEGSPLALAVAAVTAGIEPALRFQAWLAGRLAAARARESGPHAAPHERRAP